MRHTYDVTIQCMHCEGDIEIKVSSMHIPATRIDPPEDEWDFESPEECPHCKHKFTEAEHEKIYDLVANAEEPTERWMAEPEERDEW